MPLSRDEVDARLTALSGWRRQDDEIEKTYRFPDFDRAMAFVNEVARLAREADHHPDISITYDKVKLTLATHSEGGVTAKDLALAARIDALPATTG